MSIRALSVIVLFLLVLPSAMVSGAANEKQEWLSSELYGSDNDGASLRRVTIRPQADKYLIDIANQFSFQCELTFDAQGNPEKLLNCRSLLKEGDRPAGSWRTLESEIPLSCSRSRREVVCKGQYTLVGRSYTSKTYMTIARSPGASFDCSKARTGVEQIVCKDSRLRFLDRDLADTYQESLHTSHGRSVLQTQQLSWLRDVRDKCTTAECLEKAYTQRIQELEDSLVGADGMESSAYQGATATDVSGRYVRKGEDEEAELKVSALRGNRVRVEGLALWGTTNENGPHTGELNFEAPLRDGKIYFTDRQQRPPYRLRIDFQRDRLNVKEANSLGYFGLNVSFQGQYGRVSPSEDQPSTTGRKGDLKN